MGKNKQRRFSEKAVQRFFTADQHFGHTNILKYQPNRRHQNVEVMDSAIVDAWNSVVTHADTVYCVGDMSYNLASLRECLRFLNGRKVLVVGNHDPFFKDMVNGDRQRIDAARAKALEIGFAEIHQELLLEIPEIGMVKLSHFPYLPTVTEELPDYALRYPHLRPVRGNEKLLLHGHVHSDWLAKDDAGAMLNVGIDVWKMRPVSESEIVEKFQRLGDLNHG